MESGPRINAYSHLMTRVDPKQLDALFDLPEAVEAAKPAVAAPVVKGSLQPPSQPFPSKGEGAEGAGSISIDDGCESADLAHRQDRQRRSNVAKGRTS